MDADSIFMMWIDDFDSDFDLEARKNRKRRHKGSAYVGARLDAPASGCSSVFRNSIS